MKFYAIRCNWANGSFAGYMLYYDQACTLPKGSCYCLNKLPNEYDVTVVPGIITIG